MQRFTLQEGDWYGVDILNDAWSPMYRCPSPIRVNGLQPLKSGKSLLNLDYYHAFYPEGVRDKICRIQILERGSQFLVARVVATPESCVMVFEAISRDWMERAMGITVPGDDVHAWLEQNT